MADKSKTTNKKSTAATKKSDAVANKPAAPANPVSDAANKPAAPTDEYQAQKTQLNSKLKEAYKDRDALFLQLGAGLYEQTKYNRGFVGPREELYHDIAAQNKQMAALSKQLQELDLKIAQRRENDLLKVAADANANTSADSSPDKDAKSDATCKHCGHALGSDDKFCSGCGAKIEAPAPQVSFCSNCGATINAVDMFCTKCGSKRVEIST